MSRKHAVIIVHPDPESYTATMARTYAAAVRAQGDTAVIRDLYAMNFDPRLHIGELPRSEGYRLPADVANERKVLADVDVFAFFYPLWFNAPPAMMKGYVDRVFGMGFGFEPHGSAQVPMLEGRHLISFTTSGAPEHWVRGTGVLDALETLFDKHLAAMCGLSIIAHYHVGEVIPDLPLAVVNEAKNNIRAAVKLYFSREIA